MNSIDTIFYSPANGTAAAYWVVMAGDTTNYNGRKIFTSTDGLHWQQKASVSTPYTFVSMSTNPDGKTVVLARKYNWVEDAKVVVSDTGVTWNVIDFNYPANEQYYFTNILWNPINSNWIVVGAHWFFNGGWSYGNLGLQTTTPQAPTSYNKIAALSDNTLNPNMASSLIATNNSVLTVLASDGYIFYSSNGIIGLSIKLLLD